ncbi:MAG TPA: Gfo/Idh/MocA family oxidoreductase [Phycisphaerae bacterium]|nr:Gfo/Idh/MocA family oxidoreductase [Phycisphaerae bacterium]
MTTKTKIAIIGCGNISSIYIQNAYRIPSLELLALADLDPARPLAKIEEIKSKWREWNLPSEPKLPRPLTVEQLLADPHIQLVINLTIPKAHAEVALQCLHAGKHTYHEKPFALSRTEGQKILDTAKQKKLTVGCAPDTFLGAGIQTARKIIDDGLIGEPVACSAFMTCPGHEWWHPDPEFYYQPGGGPMFDMGPYYLTTLVNLLGPIARITGFARATRPTRTITSQKKNGTLIPVETPTHIASTLQFRNGAIGTMIMSFDVFGANLPRIEIYGSKGSLSVPDPNRFDGDVRMKIGRGDWETVLLTYGNRRDMRGIGAAETGIAAQRGAIPRPAAALGYHVLEVMEASLETARTGKSIEILSTVDRPAPLPPGLDDGVIP